MTDERRIYVYYDGEQVPSPVLMGVFDGSRMGALRFMLSPKGQK